ATAAARRRLENEPGMLAMGYPLRTESKGHLRLRSADPDDPPIISTNFLYAQHDQKVTVALFRFMRRLFSHPEVSPYIAEETSPGANVETDEEILDAARRDQ